MEHGNNYSNRNNRISEDGKHWATHNIIESLGGIESDSGDDCKTTIVNELNEEIITQLLSWGFRDDEIKTAFTQGKTK
jgi:hypothetical protein